MKRNFTLGLAVFVLMALTAANVHASGFYLNVMGEGNQTIAQLSSDNVRNWYFKTDNTAIFTTDVGNQLTFDNVIEIKPTVTAVSNNATALGWDLNRTAFYGGGTYGWTSESGLIVSFFETIAIINEKGVCFYNFETDEELFYNNEQIASQVWEPDIYYPDAPMILSLYVRNNRLLAGMCFLYPTGMYFYTLFDSNETPSGLNRTNFAFNNNSIVIPTSLVTNADGSVTASFTNYKGEYKEHTFREWSGVSAKSAVPENAPVVTRAGDEQVPYITVIGNDGKEKAKFAFSDTESIRCKDGIITFTKSSGPTFTYANAEITPFGFVLAAAGTGTGNEAITAAAGKVYYSNGALYIEGITGSINIYSAAGALAAVVPASGDKTEKTLPLPKGIYFAAGHTFVVR